MKNGYMCVQCTVQTKSLEPKINIKKGNLSDKLNRKGRFWTNV